MSISFTGSGGGGNISVSSNAPAITITSANKISYKDNLDGLSAATAVYRSRDIKVKNPTATTGWYWINVRGVPKQFWVDMDYDGGGWVLAAVHYTDIGFPASLSKIDYIGNSTDYYGSSEWVTGYCSPTDKHAAWLGLTAWDAITAQNAAYYGGVREFVTYIGPAVSLGATTQHSYRSRWKWTGFNSSYTWQGTRDLVNEVGGTTPGLWSYHIANNYSMSTGDYGNSCPSNYLSAPFWYGGCWDGSFWGGNGSGSHTNAAHWTGSGSNYSTYGAYYIR